MKYASLILPFIFVILPCASTFAAEAVWGLDFYTRLDESGDSVHRAIVKKHLSEKPTLDQFAKWCPKAASLKDLPTSEESLGNLEKMQYEEFLGSINQNKTSINTEEWQALTLCIDSRYSAVKNRSYEEQNNLERLSSMGAYSDGDTSNSDYDILADIEKINMILFSKDLKYEGKVNQKTSEAIADFLSGKHTKDDPISGASGSTTDASISGSGSGSGSADGSSEAKNLANLIGGTCSQVNTDGISIDDIVDENLTKELATLLGTPQNADTNGAWGYTRPVGSTQAASGSTPAETSKDDFYDKLPCTGVFCVTITMTPGSQNLLGGGKNYSIEGILDKNMKILSPIADTSLRYEKMTSNFGSAPIQDLKLKDIIAGARVFLASKPQPTRVTPVPQSAESEFEYIRTCALVAAGLSTDTVQANGLGGAGYVDLNSSTNTENVENKNLPLGPQEVKKTDGNCLTRAKDSGRTNYYNSFSSDLTQLEAFTQGFLDEIADVMNFGTFLDKKPTY